MAARFTYSRWDGTQTGFELDAESVFDEITNALRRMMHQGLQDRDGNRLPGLRELMERLRAERAERLERGDLGGVYQEIADELNDIVDEERHAIENDTRSADASGDERRATTARE